MTPDRQPRSQSMPGTDSEHAQAAGKPHAGRSGEVVSLFAHDAEHETDFVFASLPISDRVLDNQIQSAIGKHLRSLYGGLTSAPLPPRLLTLLDTLETEPR